MPVKAPDRRSQRVRGQLVDQMIANTCGLYTYAAAAERLQHTEETVRQYCKQGWFEKVYVGCTPLLTEASIVEYEQQKKRHRKNS